MNDIARSRIDDPNFRFALWDVYEGRCYICANPVDLSAMHVDHIIPEILHDTEQLEQMALHEISAGWSIHGTANLAPSHSWCNQRKGKKLLSNLLRNLALQEAGNRSARVDAKFQRLKTSAGKSRKAALAGQCDFFELDATLRAISAHCSQSRPLNRGEFFQLDARAFNGLLAQRTIYGRDVPFKLCTPQLSSAHIVLKEEPLRVVSAFFLSHTQGWSLNLVSLTGLNFELDVGPFEVALKEATHVHYHWVSSKRVFVPMERLGS